MLKLNKSQKIFEESKNYFPGGVNSPVRSFKSVGAQPPVIIKGKGAKIKDIDGNEYVDLIMSWGALILGHAHKDVIKRIKRTAQRGTSFGAITKNELQLGKLIKNTFPSIERLRFVNSGTEATMSALRLARGYTGRDKIIKFEGCYHGHSDSLLVSAGSGALTHGAPSSPGVPSSIAQNTLVATYNDILSVEKLLKNNHKQVAAVIVEPICGNMGVVLPHHEFLKSLRELTIQEDVLLILDEVITGFRVGLGGAQELYNILPDITCLGKIIGGGLPVGTYGGKKEIMDKISPDGPIYQAGTLSGNPLAMAAGIETLNILNAENPYEALNLLGNELENKIKQLADSANIPLQVNRIGSMLTLFFTDTLVTNYATALKSDTSKFSKFFSNMFSCGIYIPPSQFETLFLSTAHTKKDIIKIVRAIKSSLTNH